MSLFVQDTWKATPRLTVNAGLRYDYTFIPPYGTNATIGKQGGIETGDYDFSNGTLVAKGATDLQLDGVLLPAFPAMERCLPTSLSTRGARLPTM